jgi:hypothetical protein
MGVRQNQVVSLHTSVSLRTPVYSLGTGTEAVLPRQNTGCEIKLGLCAYVACVRDTALHVTHTCSMPETVSKIQTLVWRRVRVPAQQACESQKAMEREPAA